MKNEKDIYHKIANILMIIISSEAKGILFDGFIYDSSAQLGCFDILPNDDKKYIDLSSKYIIELEGLIRDLRECEIFSVEKWTHFEFYLSKDAKFKMNFAYIPEEDSWVNLIMRGISDLTEDESKKLGIPKDLWLERIKHKGTGTLGKPKSEFY